jgi:hypothetical protein
MFNIQPHYIIRNIIFIHFVINISDIILVIVIPSTLMMCQSEILEQ